MYAQKSRVLVSNKEGGDNILVRGGSEEEMKEVITFKHLGTVEAERKDAGQEEAGDGESNQEETVISFWSGLW